jgi:hypothetical protein
LPKFETIKQKIAVTDGVNMCFILILYSEGWNKIKVYLPCVSHEGVWRKKRMALLILNFGARYG